MLISLAIDSWHVGVATREAFHIGAERLASIYARGATAPDHETVALVDAAFGEFAGGAEILKFGATRLAIRIVAGAADGRDDEVAGFEAADVGANFFNDAEGFVADDEIFKAGGRRAVNKGADFLVGAADANFQGTDFYFVVAGDFGRNVFDQLDFFASLENTYRSHR
jgi:hypothetical protein